MNLLVESPGAVRPLHLCCGREETHAPRVCLLAQEASALEPRLVVRVDRQHCYFGRSLVSPNPSPLNANTKHNIVLTSLERSAGFHRRPPGHLTPYTPLAFLLDPHPQCHHVSR